MISPKQIILHWEYDPDGIRREKIRELYNTHLGGLLSSPIEEVDGGLATDRMIVAYSRPPNLRDQLQSAKLHQIEGEEVSTYFGS